MNTRKAKPIIIIGALIALFTIDRYFFMNRRIVDNNWSYESGDYVGVDPMHVGQHCELRGNKIFFYEEREEFWIAGCSWDNCFFMTSTQKF